MNNVYCNKRLLFFYKKKSNIKEINEKKKHKPKMTNWLLSLAAVNYLTNLGISTAITSIKHSLLVKSFLNRSCHRMSNRFLAMLKIMNYLSVWLNFSSPIYIHN